MPALHVRSLRIPVGDHAVWATLQVARNEAREVVLRVALSRQPARGRERPIGHALLNRAGELVQAPEDLTDTERAAVEQALAQALA